VRHQRKIPQKLQSFGQDFRDPRGLLQLGLANAGQLLNAQRKGAFGPDELAVFSYQLALFKQRDADLDNLAAGFQTGGLQVYGGKSLETRSLKQLNQA
jgi:hypothetical protein